MPKLLSRSKHEDSSQTQHCRLEIRRKEEHKIQRKWKVRNLVPAALFIQRALFMSPAVTVHLLFDALPVCFNFCFLPILSLLIPYDFGFFCNFPLF